VCVGGGSDRLGGHEVHSFICVLLCLPAPAVTTQRYTKRIFEQCLQPGSQ
jgi:hypothetical protein